MASVRTASSPSTSGRADDGRRRRVDTALWTHAHGWMPGRAGGPLTERRVAEWARDAAEAIQPLLGDPPRSLHRIRSAIEPVLTCSWTEFDAVYDAALDALLALPPARPDVEDPAWDAHLAPDVGTNRAASQFDPAWVVPEVQGVVVGPRGTRGIIVRHTGVDVLLTGDGRSVLLRTRCTCDPQVQRVRPFIPYESVHLGRSGTIIDVTAGIACGVCRAVCG